jgi:hypothetical protein
MPRSSSGHTPQPGATSGEILVGLSWFAFYGALALFSLAHDAAPLLAALNPLRLL